MLPQDRAHLVLDLHVDGLRLAILTALNARGAELQQLVDAEVERVKQDLPGMVRAAVQEGIQRAIRGAVESQMSELRAALQPAVGAAVRDLIGKAVSNQRGSPDLADSV